MTGGVNGSGDDSGLTHQHIQYIIWVKWTSRQTMGISLHTVCCMECKHTVWLCFILLCLWMYVTQFICKFDIMCVFFGGEGV